MDKALVSRILEELLPFECDECGYEFERTLAEYFDIGVRCPKCSADLPLDEKGLEDIITGLALVYNADLYDDQRNVPPTLRNALRSGKPPT